MTSEKPDLPGALNQLTAVSAPMAAERGSLSTRHGQLDFARRTLIMGIINVTPDSFFDGGRRYDPEKAVADGVVMAASGADILDVGGESTRPGAQPVSEEQELARVLPVVRGLRRAVGAPISIDTYKSTVARAALDAGADIVNDVSALRFDAAMAPMLAAEKVPVILMHMQGTPQTMQQDPHYSDVVREVRDFLAARCSKRWTRALPRITSSSIQASALAKTSSTICYCCVASRRSPPWASLCSSACRAKDLSARS